MDPGKPVKIYLIRHHSSNQNSKNLVGRHVLSTLLSDARKLFGLLEHQFFLEGSSTISKQGQPTLDLSDIVKTTNEQNIIHIQSFKKQVQKQSELSFEDKLQQYSKTQQYLEQMLKELNQGKINNSTKNQEEIRNQISKMEKLKQRLSSVDPEFKTINFMTDLNQVQSLLKKQLKRNQNLIKQYKQTVKMSPNELFQKTKGIFCTYLGPEIKENVQIVNFKQSEIRSFDTYKDQNYKEFYTKSHQVWENVKSRKDQQILKSHSGVKAFSPLILINLGFDAAYGKQKTQNKQSCLQSRQVHQIFYGLSICNAYTIPIDNIKLAPSFMNSIKQCFQFFIKTLSKSDKSAQEEIQQKIKQKIQKIIDKYGWQIQIGTYVYGGKFLVKNSYSFHEGVKFEEKQSVCNKEASMVVNTSKWKFAGYVQMKGANNMLNSDKDKITSLKYTVTRQSNTFTDNYSDWLEVIQKNMKHWKLIYSETKKVLISVILNNSHNRLEYQGSYDCFQIFTSYFDRIYWKKLNQKNLLKDSDDYILCVVGKSGVGKSTFVNQIVGRSLDEPCYRSGSAKGVTCKVQRYEVFGLQLRAKIIDTPGFFDNMNREKNMKQQLINIIYQKKNDQKFYETKLKYVDCFVLVVKVGENDRLEIKRQIEELEKTYGFKIYDSLMIVINFPSLEVKNNKWSECLQVKDLLDIEKVKNKKFKIDKQVTWNVLTDPQTSQGKNWRKQFLFKCKTYAKIFTSKDYESYAQKRIEENIKLANEEIKKTNQQLQVMYLNVEEEEDMVRKEDLRMEIAVKQNIKLEEYFLNDLSCLTLTYLQPVQPTLWNLWNSTPLPHYIELGLIQIKTYGLLAIRISGNKTLGFRLSKEAKKLMLISKELDIERGTLSGNLVDASQPEMKMCMRNPQIQGQRLICSQNGDKVALQFKGGKQGLWEFFQTRKAKVYIKIGEKYVKFIKNQKSGFVLKYFFFPIMDTESHQNTIVHTSNLEEKSQFELAPSY